MPLNLNLPVSPQEFVDAIFSRASTGYVCVVEVPDQPSQTYKQRWENPLSNYLAIYPGYAPRVNEVLREPVNHPAAAFQLNASDWYFCPSVFSERNRRRTAVVSASTLWIDCDDPDGPDPNTFDPKPSIIVESSPGRFHCYWLLNEALSAVNVEHMNRRLSFNYDADRSGWDAVQLLRLPYGINSKKANDLWSVRVTKFMPTLRYDLDAFEHLQSPLDPTAASDTVVPLPREPRDPDDILSTYETKLSRSFKKVLEERQADRSRALWFLSHECYRAGIPVESAYWLLRGTPNDKFSGQRSGGDEALWRDILAAYQTAAVVSSDDGVINKIHRLLTGKMSRIDKYHGISGTVLNDMEQSGKFYQTDRNEFYYLQASAEGTARMIELNVNDTGLKRLLGLSYGLNATLAEYKYVASDLEVRAGRDPAVTTHRLAYFDTRTMTLYVNRFDGTMFRLDGSTVATLPNGTHDVLFIDPPGASPLPNLPVGLPEPSAEKWKEFVLSCSNITAPPGEHEGIGKEGVQHIMMSWIAALYFKELCKVKPILFLHGEPGSGKTASFKGMGQTLLSPTWIPTQKPAKEEDFDHAVSTADFVVFDNVDSYVPWLTDKLALAATSYTVTKRKLYTNNDQWRATISTYVGLTAFSPKFRRHDVVQRMIPIRVEPFKDALINEHTIYERIVTHRSALWIELLSMLQSTVAILKARGLNTFYWAGNLRLGDYSVIMSVLGEILEVPPEPIIKYIQTMQAKETVEDDIVTDALLAWLSNANNINRVVTPDTLHLELTSLNQGNEIRKRFPTPKGLSTRLGQLESSLPAQGIVMERVSKKPSPWRFRLLDDGPEI